MSRGKFCRRKSNEKSRVFVIHQNIDKRPKPHHHVNSHNDHYSTHPRIDNVDTVNGKAYIQQPVIEPEASISFHEEELQYEEPIGLETSTDMNGDTLKGVPALLKVFGERIGDMDIFGVINRFFKR